jgi:acyl carrier protein
VRWTFAAELLGHDAVKAMSAEFQCLLEGIACHPARPISALHQPAGVDGAGVELADHAMASSGMMPSRISAAPSTSVERALVRIWADNLHMQEELIGVTDSYFDIGGDSLRTITLAATIRDTMQAKVSIADIFSYPTIQKLARHIAGDSMQPPINRVESSDSKSRIMRARKHMTT